MNPGGRCELDENKICDGCNECNRCDLDPTKLCDSCGKCLDLDSAEYKEVFIDGIANDEAEADEYLSDYDADYNSDNNSTLQEGFESGVEYIEDIPELKKKYDEELSRIFKEMGNK